MLVAKKDNKVYNVTETDKARYLEEGYDIYKDGKVVEYSPKKKVTYSEYAKVKEELEKAKAEAGSSNNEELTKQVEDLTSTNAELTKSNEDLTKQVEKLTKQLEKAKAE